jgi:capsular exopolysaccharide synthesis family protein
MSRIFDALQRLESERSDVDSATLPQGPELLKRAERRAVSNWDRVAAQEELKATSNVIDEDRADQSFISLPRSTAEPLNQPESAITEQRPDLLEEFQTLEVSLPPQSRLVCLTDRENPTAEAIRLLGVRLRDMRQTRPLKKILMTSTIPQEGKSMLSANLACALAHAYDAKVLLVEGDLRRPSLSLMFGIDKHPGIYEWLQAENDKIENIYYLKDAGVWILPAGGASSDPIEYLQSQRLRVLVDRVSALFDWIIIDSPPILPLADTSVWMRLSDGVLLVTRQGTTEKRQLLKGLDAVDRKKLIGALLNGSEASAYSGYYYSSVTSS